MIYVSHPHGVVKISVFQYFEHQATLSYPSIASAKTMYLLSIFSSLTIDAESSS